jgi:hypothetical protein
MIMDVPDTCSQKTKAHSWWAQDIAGYTSAPESGERANRTHWRLRHRAQNENTRYSKEKEKVKEKATESPSYPSAWLCPRALHEPTVHDSMPTCRYQSAYPNLDYFRFADRPTTLVGCLLHVLNQDGTAIYHNGLAGGKTFLH